MKLVYIDNELKEAWEHLVQQSPYSGFMQSFFWSEFKRNTNWSTFKIGLIDNEQLVGGASILKYDFSENKNFLYIPEGPVLDYSSPKAELYFHAIMSEIDKIADFEGAQNTSHMRINPRLKDLPNFFEKFTKAPVDMEPRLTVMVDLSATKEAMLARMKPKGRYNIKIAEKAGVTVRQASSDDDLKSFLKLYNETCERNDLEGQNIEYFEKLIDVLQSSHQGNIFLAEHQHDILAAALVITYGNRSSYFFGASTSLKKEKMAPYKLHWEAIKYAKSQNSKWYDFWGVSATEDKDHSWAGISQFKRKFGVEEFSFIGCYDFIYDHKLYQEFLNESGEIPK